MSARPRSAGGTRAGWKREASSPSLVRFVLCSALVYTALASLHRTNSPATRLQQPVAPRKQILAAGVAMSWQKAAGSRDDSALSAIKRHVGGGACYHEFPRMSLLGSSVNKDREEGAVPLLARQLPSGHGEGEVTPLLMDGGSLRGSLDPLL